MGDECKEWLEYAEQDYTSANHLYKTCHPKPLEVICYLCQQAAEKSLKGYLVFKNAIPPKVHVIKQLRGICSQYDMDFANLKFADDLTDYITTTRYPGNDFALDEPMTQKALSDAAAVLDFVKTKIQEANT